MNNYQPITLKVPIRVKIEDLGFNKVSVLVDTETHVPYRECQGFDKLSDYLKYLAGLLQEIGE